MLTLSHHLLLSCSPRGIRTKLYLVFGVNKTLIQISKSHYGAVEVVILGCNVPTALMSQLLRMYTSEFHKHLSSLIASETLIATVYHKTTGAVAETVKQSQQQFINILIKCYSDASRNGMNL